MSTTDHLAIITFITGNYPLGANIDADTELVRSEIIDSYGIVQMIQFLEDSYSISFPDEDITPDNFRNAKAIVECINRIRAAA